MKIVVLGKLDVYSNDIIKYINSLRLHRIEQTSEKVTTEYLSQFDIGISWMYRHILHEEQLNSVPLGILNNHPAMLPWGRGAMPNVWALLGEPAGVTLHYMSVGVDEGDIIFQKEVDKLPTDTAETLYNRLLWEQYQLFIHNWWKVERLGEKGERHPSTPQPRLQPNGFPYPTHRVKDVQRIDNLDKYDHTRGRLIVDLLKARTFPPHESAYFTENGKKYYVRVSIEEANAD